MFPVQSRLRYANRGCYRAGGARYVLAEGKTIRRQAQCGAAGGRGAAGPSNVQSGSRWCDRAVLTARRPWPVADVGTTPPRGRGRRVEMLLVGRSPMHREFDSTRGYPGEGPAAARREGGGEEARQTAMRGGARSGGGRAVRRRMEGEGAQEEGEWRWARGAWVVLERGFGPTGVDVSLREACVLEAALVWRRVRGRWRRWVVVTESAVMRREGWRGLGLFAWEQMAKGVEVGRYEGERVGPVVEETDARGRERAQLDGEGDMRLWVRLPLMVEKADGSWGWQVQQVDASSMGPPFLQRANDRRGKGRDACKMGATGVLKVEAEEGVEGLAGRSGGWAAWWAAELTWEYGDDFWRQHEGRMAAGVSTSSAAMETRVEPPLWPRVEEVAEEEEQMEATVGEARSRAGRRARGGVAEVEATAVTAAAEGGELGVVVAFERLGGESGQVLITALAGRIDGAGGGGRAALLQVARAHRGRSMVLWVRARASEQAAARRLYGAAGLERTQTRGRGAQAVWKMEAPCVVVATRLGAETEEARRRGREVDPAAAAQRSKAAQAEVAATAAAAWAWVRARLHAGNVASVTEGREGQAAAALRRVHSAAEGGYESDVAAEEYLPEEAQCRRGEAEVWLGVRGGVAVGGEDGGEEGGGGGGGGGGEEEAEEQGGGGRGGGGGGGAGAEAEGGAEGGGGTEEAGGKVAEEGGEGVRGGGRRAAAEGKVLSAREAAWKAGGEWQWSGGVEAVARAVTARAARPEEGRVVRVLGAALPEEFDGMIEWRRRWKEVAGAALPGMRKGGHLHQLLFRQAGVWSVVVTEGDDVLGGITWRTAEEWRDGQRVVVVADVIVLAVAAAAAGGGVGGWLVACVAEVTRKMADGRRGMMLTQADASAVGFWTQAGLETSAEAAGVLGSLRVWEPAKVRAYTRSRPMAASVWEVLTRWKERKQRQGEEAVAAGGREADGGVAEEGGAAAEGRGRGGGGEVAASASGGARTAEGGGGVEEGGEECGGDKGRGQADVGTGSKVAAVPSAGHGEGDQGSKPSSQRANSSRPAQPSLEGSRRDSSPKPTARRVSPARGGRGAQGDGCASQAATCADADVRCCHRKKAARRPSVAGGEEEGGGGGLRQAIGGAVGGRLGFAGGGARQMEAPRYGGGGACFEGEEAVEVDEEMEVLAWNMRKYLHHDGAKAAEKRTAVEAVVAAQDDLVAMVLTEVGGTLKAFRRKGGMGSWLGRLGFEAKMLPGRSGVGRKGGAQMFGGVVLAWRRGRLAAVEVDRHGNARARAVSEGALVVRLTRLADGGVFELGGLYGLPQGSVAAREARIEGLLMEAAGGEGALICGDTNFKPCACFDASRAAVGRSALASRWWDQPCKGCGCGECCGEAEGGGVLDGEVELVVPRAADGRLEGTWTAAADACAAAQFTACLDWGMVMGGERGRWSVVEAFAPTRGGAADVRVSDHKMVVFRRRVVASVAARERRDMAGLPKQLSWAEQRVFQEVCRHGEAMGMGQGGGARGVQGVSTVVVEAMKATAAAREAEVKARGGGGQEEGRRRADAMVCKWTAQLRMARRLQARGGARAFETATELYHVDGGLAQVWRRHWRDGGEELRRRVMHRCRAEFAYWVRRRRADEKRRYQEVAEGVTRAAQDGDAGRGMRLLGEAFRRFRAKGTSIALTEVYVNDDPACEKIKGSDERQPGVLRDIGAANQVKFCGEGVVAEAYAAWCGVWMEKWEELRMEDGERWTVREAVTFDVFDEVLTNMAKKRKAAGRGGMRLEALRLAPESLRRRFWEGMVECAESGVFPDAWHHVIYVLLNKKHGDQAVLSNRRDIALMAQEMKLLCGCVKMTAYSRMAGRIDAAQQGFCAGTGTSDAALLTSLLLQTSRRRGGNVYLLWIDIQKFFPAVDRTVLKMTELWHGVPEEVRRLTTALYGEMIGVFDSASGLGDDFDIYMGCLMGCVLSPDRAKLLLNTVMVAIRAYVRGVTLDGCGGRTVASVCYCDDYMGLFDDEGEWRKCWEIWTMWSEMSGCRLGVAFDKTCCAAAKWVRGRLKAVDVEEPLRMPDGREVPRLAVDGAYPHLGIRRTPGGDVGVVWAQVRRAMQGFLARLRAMRHLRAEEFVMLTNAIVAGVGSFFGAVVWLGWTEADKIEGKWREEFRRRFGGARSTPRFFYYEGLAGGRGLRREHLFVTMAAALYDTMCRAMCDTRDWDARAAARAEVSAAAWRWGCRAGVVDWCPRGTEWLQAIEAALQRRGQEWLGDAFWLVRGWVVAARGGAGGMEVHQQLGRGDMLRSTEVGFASAALWQPVEEGGLGLRVRGTLVVEGVVEVAQLCCQGVQVVRWMSFAEAVADGRIAAGAERRAAWYAVQGEVKALRMRPTLGGAGGVPGRAVVREGPRQGEGRVDAAAASALRTALAREREERGSAVAEKAARASGEAWSGSTFDFAGALRSMFPDARPAEATQVHERQGVGPRMVGPRMVYFLPEGVMWDERGVREGEVAAAARRQQDELQRWSLDEEGWLCLDGAAVRDAEGLVCACAEADVELTPAVELQVRARARLAEADAPVRVLEEMSREERRSAGNFVDAARSRSEWGRIAAACAEHDVRAVWTLDGSLKRVKEGPEAEKKTAGRAAMRHCGRLCGGRLEAAEDSYHTEMAAEVDALHSETEKRVMVIFDAASPPQALHKWLRLHDRRRGGYYLDQSLSTLEALLEKFEVVLFFWTSSHKGVVLNELADILAGEAVAQTQVTAVPLLWCRHRSLGMGAKRTDRSEAAEACRGVVLARMRAASVESVWMGPGDWDVGKGSAFMERVARALAGRRWATGDPKTLMGRLGAEVRGEACPCCGLRVVHDGIHMCFECEGVRPQRETVLWCGQRLQSSLEGGTHDGLNAFVEAMRVGLGGAARPKLWRPPGAARMRMQTAEEAAAAVSPRASAETEAQQLRAMCVIWAKPAQCAKDAKELAMKMRMAVHGLAVAFGEKGDELVKRVRERRENEAALRAAWSSWEGLVRHAGPACVTALRAARRGTVAAGLVWPWVVGGRAEAAQADEWLRQHWVRRRRELEHEMDVERRRAEGMGEEGAASGRGGGRALAWWLAGKTWGARRDGRGLGRFDESPSERAWRDHRWRANEEELLREECRLAVLAVAGRCGRRAVVREEGWGGGGWQVLGPLEAAREWIVSQVPRRTCRPQEGRCGACASCRMWTAVERAKRCRAVGCGKAVVKTRKPKAVEAAADAAARKRRVAEERSEARLWKRAKRQREMARTRPTAAQRAARPPQSEAARRRWVAAEKVRQAKREEAARKRRQEQRAAEAPEGFSGRAWRTILATERRRVERAAPLGAEARAEQARAEEEEAAEAAARWAAAQRLRQRRRAQAEEQARDEQTRRRRREQQEARAEELRVREELLGEEAARARQEKLAQLEASGVALRRAAAGAEAERLMRVGAAVRKRAVELGAAGRERVVVQRVAPAASGGEGRSLGAEVRARGKRLAKWRDQWGRDEAIR